MAGEKLKETLVSIYHREQGPRSDEYLEKVNGIIGILDSEEEIYRPRSADGRPGGLVYLNKSLDTIIVPDLHARMDFFLHVLLHEIEDQSTVLDRLALGQIQMVCVGDGFHAEARAARRWLSAFEEFKSDYANHSSMDEEMRESLGLMEMVIEVKASFPPFFHFLKGNHENISNEQGEGNYPFGKFAYEGAMVTHYIKKFYGEEFLSRFYRFEKQLPILTVGKNFLISHAEPETFYPREMVIDYRTHPEVIYGLTWTDNDAAQEDSVPAMLDYYLDETERNGAYYFGGHRPIGGKYHLRAGGKYVQIHNPNRFIAAFLKKNKEIDLDEDIIEIVPNMNQIG